MVTQQFVLLLSFVDLLLISKQFLFCSLVIDASIKLFHVLFDLLC